MWKGRRKWRNKKNPLKVERRKRNSESAALKVGGSSAVQRLRWSFLAVVCAGTVFLLFCFTLSETQITNAVQVRRQFIQAMKNKTLILLTGESNSNTSSNFSVSFHPRKVFKRINSNSSVSENRNPTPSHWEGSDKMPKSIIVEQPQSPRLPSQNSSFCQPHKKIVFLKTHKTGSSTITTMFERFGYKNSLLFALPAKEKAAFSWKEKFSLGMLPRSKPNQKKYDMLVNHAIFDYSVMKKVVPGAKFITIVRHPIKQLESAFGFFEGYKKMKLENRTNPFEVFMQDPAFYIKRRPRHDVQFKSGQIFDLGLKQVYLDNKTVIDNKIKALDKEFDLVMINEYFDHSLILLKKMLCWTMEDILYFSKGVRSDSHRFNTSREGLKDKILEWNYADLRLFQHFNETLWRKIEEYGYDEFYQELALFQQKQKEAEKTCLEPNIIDTSNKVVKPALRKTAPAWCVDMLRGDVSFVPLIRRKQKSRLVAKPRAVVPHQNRTGTKPMSRLPAKKKRRPPRGQRRAPLRA